MKANVLISCSADFLSLVRLSKPYMCQKYACRLPLWLLDCTVHKAIRSVHVVIAHYSQLSALSGVLHTKCLAEVCGCLGQLCRGEGCQSRVEVEQLVPDT